MTGNMASEKWVHRISPDSSEFVGFQPFFQILPESGEISPESSDISPESLFTHVEITVEDMLGNKKLLLRAFWEKMHTLRNFETSGGYIVNFYTSVAELKIAINFRGLICTFPYNISIS